MGAFCGQGLRASWFWKRAKVSLVMMKACDGELSVAALLFTRSFSVISFDECIELDLYACAV